MHGMRLTYRPTMYPEYIQSNSAYPRTGMVINHTSGRDIYGNPRKCRATIDIFLKLYTLTTWTLALLLDTNYGNELKLDPP